MAPPQRPEHVRSKSGFSFHSRRSSGGEGKVKMDLTETEKERQKAKFQGKSHVNPNRAVQEAEPAARAQENATLASLRHSQHFDWQGNPIADPDSSNPARARLERPLDTIRSFEAAIDSSYNKKAALSRSQSSDPYAGGSSRPGSVIGTDININPRSQAAIPTPQFRRQPYQRDPYDIYAPRGPPSSYPRRGPGPRMHSAPYMDRPYSAQGYHGGYNGYGGGSRAGSRLGSYNTYGDTDGLGYPQHSHQESFDTNGDSTGSPSEPWANSTDPSSENSSVDRIHAAKHSNSSSNENGGNDAYGSYGPTNGGQSFYGGGYGGPGNGSPMRQAITEERWNDDDRGYEGDYDYRDYRQEPYQSNPRSHQQQPSQPGSRPSPTRESGMRGPPPPPSHQYAPQPAPQQQMPRPNMASRNNDHGGSFNGPYPSARPVPTAAPPQSYNQPQKAQRPGTLQKKPSEKRKSWFKRVISR